MLCGPCDILQLMSLLTFWLRRTSVHLWPPPGSVCAPGRPSMRSPHPQALSGKPTPAAGKTAHVRRLLVDRSRCGLVVSPAPPGDTDVPRYGRRAVVATEG